MKHGKRPQINGCGIKPGFHHFAQCIQIGTPVMVHDTFRKSGSTTRVIDGDILIFIIHVRNDRRRRPRSQKFLVFHALQRFIGADVTDIHKGFDLCQFIHDRIDDSGKFIVHKHSFGV